MKFLPFLDYTAQYQSEDETKFGQLLCWMEHGIDSTPDTHLFNSISFLSPHIFIERMGFDDRLGSTTYSRTLKL